MKFLAILKDSLREALDTKVFYVMVGFSLLVVLFVASVGYRPVSVEDEVRRTMTRMTWVLQRVFEKNNLGAAPVWDVKDFEQTKPGSPPWDTGYRFALTVEFTNAEQAAAARKTQKNSLADIEKGLRPQLLYLKNLKVTEAEPQSPVEIRYQVTSEGARSKRFQDWPHEPVILYLVPIPFWHGPVGEFVQFWEDKIINGIGAAVALLISSIITAFFIPNMLRKGTVDMLIVKPISRPSLLLYKYIGGLIFIFLNTAVIVVGIWLVLGLRTNLWGARFLLSIGILMFQFAFYYAVSTLFAVLTRSPIVAILMTCLSWFIFALLIGYGFLAIDQTRKIRDVLNAQVEVSGEQMPEKQEMPEKLLPDWVYTTADTVHFVTPHLKDLDVLTTKWSLEDVYPPDNPQRKVADKVFGDFRWAEAFLVTSLYIVVLLGLSCWRFATRDY
jgi:ABC-type transport system involved in multi-copper enzyme maturation permease subunit